MGILICYDDFSYDVVCVTDLHELLEKGSIIGYDNSGDWIKCEGLPTEIPASRRKTKPSLAKTSKSA